MEKITQLHVNGNDAPIEAEGERTLLSVLRDDLNLTGPKYGCGEGRCGACTVLLEARPSAPARLPSAASASARWSPSKGWSKTADCIRCRMRFSNTMRSNA